MRQDIERNKNKQEYQFMQETIKKRPTERRSMARRLLAVVQQLHLQKCFLSWQIKKRMHSRK